MTRMTKDNLVENSIRLREECEALEKRLAALRTQRPTAQRPTAQPQVRSTECVVAEYTKRDGTRWIKVCISWNTYAHRQIA